MVSALAVFGCGGRDGPGPTVVIEGVALAGPVCPVETDPPDPSCEPQPVPSATITAFNEDTGEETAVVTDADGRFRIELEGGTIQVRGAPVEGLLGVPDPVTIVAADGDRHTVDLVYDTGIR